MKFLLIFPLAAAVICMTAARSHAVTLAEYAERNPLKLFIATKGAVMPNATDQTNTLKEGDRALILSGKGLTDIAGISTLSVEDAGKRVPIRAVENLHLFFNHNEIASIPAEIGALKNVMWIYFEFNRLDSLPGEIAQMDALKGMFFTANRFTEIPPFVFGMTGLHKLQFSKNKIASLPSDIGRLSELRHFNMANNEIAAIPDSIAKLTLLRVCDLSDNRFASLPEAFGAVKIAHQLRVRNNPLVSLPAGFAAMPGTIDITGTKIDVEKLAPELRARISTEKPPGKDKASKQTVKSGKAKD